MSINDLIDRLARENRLDQEELLYLLDNLTVPSRAYLILKADEARNSHYGKQVYLRGLVEFTNYCKRNCLYCGIRAGNGRADRYRLSEEEIIGACAEGWNLGYRSFVLQGGEDDYFSDAKIVALIKALKRKLPGCALALSLGEKSRQSYQEFFWAGADRYLLRQETVSPLLYRRLHPGTALRDRINCLYALKEIGYQVGAGFLVGLPGQTNQDYVQDLLFLKELQPQMVGIGPFIPHRDTPLAGALAGTVETTITMLAITRLLLPTALIPATTALGTIDPLGREQGLKAGANVVMPNLSPPEVRSKYALYDGKICIGEEAAECRQCISARINGAGFVADFSRGDHLEWRNV